MFVHMDFESKKKKRLKDRYLRFRKKKLNRSFILFTRKKKYMTHSKFVKIFILVKKFIF